LNKIVVFTCANQQYGIDIQHAHSIERVFDITNIPHAPQFIKGVIHLRGEIIPIIDLKKRLNIGEAENVEQMKIIIVHMSDVAIGLLVDDATDILDIEDADIEASTHFIANIDQTTLKGVAKLEDKLLLLLDVPSIFKRDEMIKIKEIMEDET